MPREIDIDLDYVRAERTKGRSLADIAKDVGVGRSVLSKRLSKYADTPDVRQESTEPREFHECANIFPLMSERDYRDLVRDIHANGVREPIRLYDGKILDGRNRYRACMELGIPYRWEVYEGENPLAYVISLNVQRRHLTDSQRVGIACNLATMRQGERTDLSAVAGKLSQGEAASLLHVSVDQMTRFNLVHDRGIEALQAAVRAEEISISAAAELAKEPPDVQLDVLQDIRSGQQKSVNEALKSRPRGTKSSSSPPPPPGSQPPRSVERTVIDASAPDNIYGGRDPTQWFYALYDPLEEACQTLKKLEATGEPLEVVAHMINDLYDRLQTKVEESTKALAAFQVYFTPAVAEDDTNTPEEVNHGHQK